MSRAEKRIQIRIFGEDDSVPDEEALLDTLVIRYMNRLEDLSRENFKSWLLQAFRNQYQMDTQGMQLGKSDQDKGVAKNKVSEPEAISDTKMTSPEPEPEPEPESVWGQDTGASNLVVM